MRKVTDRFEEVLQGNLFDGMTIAVGGFGIAGTPSTLIDMVKNSGVKNLTIVSNNMGIDGFGLGKLLENGQVSKVLASYIGENKLFMEQYLSGEVEVEFVPQGTLAERIRAGGSGIGGFYTQTAVGTEIAEGKPTREINGKLYVLETAIESDIALVKAYKADLEGNLRFRLAARNFNPLVAQNGKTTFVEAESILPLGELGPDDFHTPGVFVHYITQSTVPSRIENVVNRPYPGSQENREEA